MRVAIWVCCWALVLGAGSARGGVLQGADGLEALGRFAGTLTYTYSDLDPTRAVLRIELQNTTPAALGGYLTAFALNNPGQRIQGVDSFAASGGHFQLLGGPTFDNGVNGAPFGMFDLGASTGASWQGGGRPSRGIGVGASATFTFHLRGAGLNELTDADFLQEFSAPERDGEGTQVFVARFRGFADGGSDKVPADLPQFSEPSSVALAMVGLAGAALYGGRRQRRKRTGAEAGKSNS